jgi:adenylylsulfate kinase-like enzyme
VFLPVRGWNILVTGESGSGKSWVTGLLAEQGILAHYSVCVIDPEGDYARSRTCREWSYWARTVRRRCGR